MLPDTKKRDKNDPDIQYRPFPKGTQWCSRCSMFEKPNSCTLVAGTISPDGWCKKWETK